MTTWHLENEQPPATMDEAHREWHRNVGHPVGTVSCPWDACDPEGNVAELPLPTATKPDGYVYCGNHAETERATSLKHYHASAADVASCYRLKAHGFTQMSLDSLVDWTATRT